MMMRRSSSRKLSRPQEKKQEVSFHVVGDAFVDLLCFLEQDFPERGGDALLEKPIETMAGGSAVNTCTHLMGLIANERQKNNGTRDTRETYEDEDESITVNVQTVLNPNDEYGRLLLRHAREHNFSLSNCLPENSSLATGHCVVIVGDGERSFMTHRGCMAKFEASHLDEEALAVGGNNRLVDAKGFVHYEHVHVAGYYNLEGFWNGNLQAILERIKQERTSLGHETAISLVPQYDATEAWDGQLVDLIPLIDFLILNEVEASSIVRSNRREHNEATVTKENDEDLQLLDWAAFFDSLSPNLCVVVTRGPKGAVALREKKILVTQPATHVEHPVDPTGAGDAFAAGFLHGIWTWKTNHKATDTEGQEGHPWPVEAIREGLACGCGVGTCCVMIRGASVPAPPQDIENYVKQAKDSTSK